jgi:hypothetical protein
MAARVGSLTIELGVKSLKRENVTAGSDRLRSAWVRLGTDKFFSPRKIGEENWIRELWLVVCRTQSVGVGRFGPLEAA